MAAENTDHLALPKLSEGSLRGLFALVMPICLISFSGCLLGFIERIWFSAYSLDALQASYSAINVLRIFQLPCIALVMMAQAFVGYYNGAQERESIGRCIWQMIWFSLLSMVVIIPVSLYVNKFYFRGIEVEHLISPYFFILSFSNFLFPLGAALSSFYLGRGKTKFIVTVTLLAHLLNMGLDFILIFGLSPWIPALGLKGAAFATLISQGMFCLVLLMLFLHKSHQEIYKTHRWSLQPKIFFRYISSSFPRALGRIILLGVWAANAHVMSSKGGDYFLILSIGGTLSLFLSFIGDGFLQALIVLISNALGAKNVHLIKKTIYGGFIFLLIVGALLAFPLILFPDTVLAFFSLKGASVGHLHGCLTWVWLHTILYIFNTIPLSVLLAKKDTIFTFILTLTTCVTSYVPVYCGINYWNLSPDKFWLLTCSSMFISLFMYSWRISYKKWLQSDINSGSTLESQRDGTLS